jgi:uncharacterized membrane protein YqjE
MSRAFNETKQSQSFEKDSKISDDLHDVKDKMRETAEAISQTASHVKDKASEMLKNSYQEVKERSGDIEKKVVEYVHKNPLTEFNMKNENNISLAKIFRNIATNFFGLIGNYKNLIALEARFAGANLIKMIALSLVLISLLTSTWISLLILLFLFFKFLNIGDILAIALIFFINICCLFAVWLVMQKMKTSLSFPATRRQLLEKNNKAKEVV